MTVSSWELGGKRGGGAITLLVFYQNFALNCFRANYLRISFVYFFFLRTSNLAMSEKRLISTATIPGHHAQHSQATDNTREKNSQIIWSNPTAMFSRSRYLPFSPSVLWRKGRRELRQKQRGGRRETEQQRLCHINTTHKSTRGLSPLSTSISIASFTSARILVLETCLCT